MPDSGENTDPALGCPYSWDSPLSITYKQALIERAYGDGAPGYLFYHLGRQKPSLVDMNERFFPGEHFRLARLDIDRSDKIKGMTRVPGAPFNVLMVKGTKHVIYRLDIGGEQCHLIEFAPADGRDMVMDGEALRRFSFRKHWCGASEEASALTLSVPPMLQPVSPRFFSAMATSFSHVREFLGL
jgi:hypothetical protein